MAGQLTIEEKRLIRRYLVWCYKTTKEDLDRMDRKFTQLAADDFILKQLLQRKGKIRGSDRKGYNRKIDDFKRYIGQKKKDAFRLKFENRSSRRLNPNYLYLKNRLSAVERAIVFFIGKKELKKIKSLYEEQMTKRILEAQEHT